MARVNRRSPPARSFPARLTRLRLRLNGLGSGPRWWDGECLGVTSSSQRLHVRDHANGADCHDLAIADNRFDAERTPLFPPYSDFYAYGGIYRSIEPEELPLRVERIRVQTLTSTPPGGPGDPPGGDVPDELTLRLAFEETMGSSSRPGRREARSA